MRKLHILSVMVLLLFLLSLEGLSQYEPRFHQIFVPAKYVALMKQHILTIGKNGWGKLDQEDLHHGHLVLKPRETPLSEPLVAERLFQESIGVLYHTDERLHRWRGEDGNLPVEQKRPRSLVAYWNGSVVVASSLFQNVDLATVHYSCCGSIHMDELASERPREFAFWRGYQMAVRGNRPCHVNLIIDIYYSSLHPPMIELGGKKYVMTMDCAASAWR